MILLVGLMLFLRPLSAEAQLSHERILWSFWHGGELTSVPAVDAAGNLYFVSATRVLYALEADGTRKWDLRAKDRRWYELAIGEDGTLYVVGSVLHREEKTYYDNFLYAINGEGEELWRVLLGPERMAWGGGSAPAIGRDGTLYVVSRDTDQALSSRSFDGALHAVSSNGRLLWRYPTGGGGFAPSVGADGTVYVGSWDGYVYAIHPDGRLRWRFEIGSWLAASPAIGSDGTVYIPSAPSRDNPHPGLYALSPEGELLWKWPMNLGSTASPVIDTQGDILLFEPYESGTDTGTLFSVTPSGAELWRLVLPGSVHPGLAPLSPLLGADETLYLIAREWDDPRWYLFCLDVLGGREFWRMALDARAVDHQMSLSDRGVLYLSSKGYLYAVQTDSPGLSDSPWPKIYGDARNTSRSRYAVTAVGEASSPVPQESALLPVYPNPFNQGVLLRYCLAGRGWVRLTLYDAAGQEVERLVDQEQAAGRYQVRWEAQGLSSGVYFCRLEAGGFSQSRKMVQVR